MRFRVKGLVVYKRIEWQDLGGPPFYYFVFLIRCVYATHYACETIGSINTKKFSCTRRCGNCENSVLELALFISKLANFVLVITAQYKCHGL